MGREIQLDLFKENNNEQTSGELKISSREIAELTGKRHRNVLRDCDVLNEKYSKLSLRKAVDDVDTSRDVKYERYKREQYKYLKSSTFGVLNNFFNSSVNVYPKIEMGYYTLHSTGGQKHREFYLTKTQTFDLMTGYNLELRIKVNRRWEELERQQCEAHSSYISEDVLCELVDKIDENKKLRAENELMLSKAKFYDDVMDSESLVDIKNVADVLNFKGVDRIKLFDFLRNKSVLMSDNLPYHKYVKLGYFNVIEIKYFDHQRVQHVIILKTMVYQKGLEFISKLLKREFRN